MIRANNFIVGRNGYEMHVDVFKPMTDNANTGKNNQ